MVDYETVKARQQQAWAAGDFSRIGPVTVLVGEMLCEAVQLHAKERVLDVATGSGNTALAAARRRCQVTGVDFVPALLERGRICAEAEHLRVEFTEGDAEKLPFDDHSFDCVLSTFGSMFAPNQERAASELLRVCRSGGRIGLACWTPESLAGRIFTVLSKRVPPPPGLRPPTRWGTTEGIRELFGADAKFTSERRSVAFRGDSPEAYVNFFGRFFGPMVKAIDSLDASAREALTVDMLALANQSNRSGDETVLLPSEYLETVVRKP